MSKVVRFLNLISFWLGTLSIKATFTMERARAASEVKTQIPLGLVSLGIESLGVGAPVPAGTVVSYTVWGIEVASVCVDTAVSSRTEVRIRRPSSKRFSKRLDVKRCLTRR